MPRGKATPANTPPTPIAPVSERTVDIADAVADMDPAFIGCRDYGHSWRPWRTKFIASQRVYESVLRCTRCRTERVRLISASGSIVGSHYEYREGYQIHGLGVLSAHDRDVIRLASMTHLAPAEVAPESKGRTA